MDVAGIYSSEVMALQYKKLIVCYWDIQKSQLITLTLYDKMTSAALIVF